MRSVGWNILILSFASLASAQVPKKCSPPPEYPSARLAEKYTQRPRYDFGDKVYYNCPKGLSLHKGTRAVQCVNGEWTKLTLKCEKKSCGNAGELPNGYFEYEENSFVGAKVYAVCNRGYTLKGRNYMICKKSGWTGKFPSCEEGVTTCSSPAVANSVKSGGYVSVYRVGENVTFTCSPGFQLDGAQQVTCGPDGQWQPKPPQCLPSPDKNEPTPGYEEAGKCGAPEAIENASPADKYFKIKSFASGDRVHYVCNIGYTPSRGSRSRMCDNGKWTRITLKCERRSCGSAGEILNGQFMYAGIEFGDIATAICDEGYILVGRATRTCMSNGWDGRIPVCEAVDCQEPPEVANAERSGTQSPYTYRSVIRYKCRVGRLIGPKEIWCTEDGTWSSPPPQCKEMTCLPPNIPNAYWMGAHTNQYQHRDTLYIECKRGYSMTGLNTITCGSDGKWSPDLPTCGRTQWTYQRHY